MPNRKARADITPEVRGAWLRAAKMQENKGRGLSELIAEAMEKDVLAALNAIAKFLPRESKVEHSGEVTNLVNVLTSLSTGHDTSVESKSDSIRH